MKYFGLIYTFSIKSQLTGLGEAPPLPSRTRITKKKRGSQCHHFLQTSFDINLTHAVKSLR